MALDGENEEYNFMPDPNTFVYFHSEPSYQVDGTKPFSPFGAYEDAYPTRNEEMSYPFESFGTYDPFQGSPLEISNFSFLDSRESAKEELLPPVQPIMEPIVEPPSLPVKEPTVEEVQKRSYKDVLTIPPSPTLPQRSIALQKNDEDSETGKPKLFNVKQDTLPNTPKHAVKTNLNNHRIQVNANPKKPVKINNNLSSSNNLAKKGNNKIEEKNNLQTTANESVRSVPSQTDFQPIIAKRKPPIAKDVSLDTPPSDDEKKYCPTTRMKDRKRNEKNRPKIKETQHEKPNTRKPSSKKSNNSYSIYSKTYVQKVLKLCGWFFMWLIDLFMDVLRMSTDLLIIRIKDTMNKASNSFRKLHHWTIEQFKTSYRYARSNYPILKQKLVKFLRRDSNSNQSNGRLGGLKANIALPASGEEAIQRLLACKGGDPYSILGVRRDCPDEEIRRYYKRQAVLVHPDKNRQRGAEEAFKILAHAFELVGHPERRSHYDRLVQQADEMESAWAELNELLSQLHAKMDETANTIRCTNCSKRHRRAKTERPCYAARYCQDCKIHHSAREGDLWAESYCMGLRSKYFACMEGAVYDITEWAFCQAGHLRHLQCNSHRVQYRIVPGQGQSGGRKQ